jgi:hypothetical protein
MSKRQKRLAHHAARKGVAPNPPKPELSFAEQMDYLLAQTARRYEETWPSDGTRVPFPLVSEMGGGLPELGRSVRHGRVVGKYDWQKSWL